VVISPDGSPIELGRTARTASPTQRRGARIRDRVRCRVPGCRSRLVHLHHLVHWIDGGDTNLGEMVSLCPRHHRNVHSGRLRSQPKADGSASSAAMAVSWSTIVPRLTAQSRM
jgi:hypothetical protein